MTATRKVTTEEEEDINDNGSSPNHAAHCLTRKMVLKHGYKPVETSELARAFYTWQRQCETPERMSWVIKGNGVHCFGCWHHCASSQGADLFDYQPRLFE